MRKVLGAYKATPCRVLEAEARISPIDITLGKRIIDYTAKNGVHPVTTAACKQVRKRLAPKRGRKTARVETPAEAKEGWALRALKLTSWEEVQREKGGRDLPKLRKMARSWWGNSWNIVWNEYQSSIAEGKRSPAQCGDLWVDRLVLHEGLRKAESSALTQMRTDKIGLADFLYKCRVPDVTSASCQCGWRRQTVKHVFMCCPLFQERRQPLIEAAGTNELFTMLTTQKGAKAAAPWLLKTQLLGQFSLANEQLYGLRACGA